MGLRMKPAAIALILLPFLAGCSEISTRTAPKADLGQLQHLYVEHLLTDGRGIDQIIAKELRKRGYDALTGPRQLMPANAEALIHYEDRWTFDFTNYMIEIDLEVISVRTGKPLATARYFRPSITGQSPVEMIDVVLNKIFKVRGAPVGDPDPLPGPESTSPST